MTMFANTRAFSGFAVGDLQAAQKFYGDMLCIATSEGISRGYGPDIAWLRDPAGNILAVLKEASPS